MIEFTHWPDNLVQKYRAEGYWVDRPLTDVLFRGPHDDSQLAIVTENNQVTYKEFKAAVLNLSNSLTKLGLKKGDTAIVQLGNCSEFYIVFLALLNIGVVPVNALASHRQMELTAYATQLHPRLLIGDRSSPLFAQGTFLEELKQNVPIEFAFFRNDDLEKLIYGCSTEDSSSCRSFSPTPAEEVAFFNLSGGSTGTPKLIPRTHNDYFYSIRRSVEVCNFTAATKYLVAIPAPHNFPVSSPGAFGVFYAGGTVVMAQDPSVSSCFPLVEKYKVTVAALVPPAASLWLHEITENKTAYHALDSIELIQIGGARLSPVLAGKIDEALPNAKLQQVFGMAEGLVNYTRLDDSDEIKRSSQGRPMSEADELYVADLDDWDRKLGPNEVGLLLTRGPYTFRGYYKSPEHNKSSFTKSGFYCSGDLISIDTNGYITVHGRQKDQINRGGEKVSAEEIENFLLRHPDVVEAGIVAIEDELMGEKSCAFVMTKRPVKPVVLRKFLREIGIADYKIPDKFKEVDELPLTPVGKVDKRRLRVLANTTSK